MHKTCRSELAREIFKKIKQLASKLAPTGLLACLLLSGCTNLPLPKQMPALTLPMQLHIQREQGDQGDQGDQRQDWLLVIQQQDAGLRWSLMDPLGIPLARQVLQDGNWHADGLLPPNPEARELFAALLFALTPQAGLAANYPQAESASDARFLGSRWQVHYQLPQAFRIDMKGNLHYAISPLEAAP